LERSPAVLQAFYRQLPEGVRRCLRPLNLVDELASFLPGPLRPPAHGVAEAARRVARLGRTRYPLRRLEGPVPGSTAKLVCLLAADDLSTRWWTSTLFGAPPAEEILGEIPVLRIPAAARRLSADADIALWQAPWPVCALATGARVPSWLPLWLETDRPLDAVISGDRSGRAGRKNDVRRVQRLGLQVRLATDTRAYDAFRRDLYEPYVRQRFGDLLVVLPRHAFQHARRHGWLLLAEHEGRPLGGAVIERWGRHPRVLVFGVDTSAEIPSGTLLEACYYHAIRFAVDRGFRRLSLGTCRPVLTDGVLRYKRKWGARIGRPATWDAFLFRYRNTPAVRAALTHAPLVVDRGDGALVALAGTHGAAAADLAAHLGRLDAPGLGEFACLVDGSIAVSGPFDPRHTAVRVVPPDEVWPPGARAA
jgi:GNAT acetyltransferase-like protein